jgi:hypothetical protein
MLDMKLMEKHQQRTYFAFSLTTTCLIILSLLSLVFAQPWWSWILEKAAIAVRNGGRK